MPQHQGKCALCKQPFAEGDDIVICPSCGAPYHRACYEKEQHCLFEKQHGPHFEYSDPEEAKKTDTPPVSEGYQQQGVLCRNCGTANDASNIFCERCGQPLSASRNTGSSKSPFPTGATPTTPPFPPYNMPNMLPPGYVNMFAFDATGEIDGISNQDWAAFIGPSANVYLSRMSRQKTSGSKLSFMASAFFLGPFYFAYRKMWGMAIITAIASLLVSVPTFLLIMAEASNPLVAGLSMVTIETLVTVSTYLGLIINIATGVFALYLYRQHAAKKIKTLRSQNEDKFAYFSALTRHGGTSAMGVLAMVLFIIVLSIIATPIFGQDLLQSDFFLF